MASHDVIAQDGDSPHFIRHVGLASKPGTHKRDEVEVAHMGPPLLSIASMTADAVGNARLTDGEIRKIKDYIDRHDSEHQAVTRVSRANISQMYCIVPHVIPFREEDGRYVRMRFSCAGFVFEAYRRARIRLLEESQLPLITLDQIKQAYPDSAKILDVPKFREAMGLMGSGPWPVMLCGYLLHSLNRDEALIRAHPHLAGSGEENFPMG